MNSLFYQRTFVCLLYFKEILHSGVFRPLVPLLVGMVNERQRPMAIFNVGFRRIDREVQGSTEWMVKVNT